MKILYVVQYFNRPGEPGGSRPYQFARHWSARGHEVEILTGGVNHKTGVVFPGLEGRLVHVERDNGFRVRRIRSYTSYKGSFRRRYLSFVTYAAAAFVLQPRGFRPDVVFASSTPLTTGIAGGMIARLRRLPFVFEARDLWPKTALVAGVLSDGPIYRAAAVAERWIYRNARDVVVVSRGDRQELIGRGLDPDRVHWVPNGVDDWILERPPGPPRDRKGPLVVTYAGAIGKWNHLDLILDIAPRLTGEVEFIVIGDGDEKPRLAERARAEGIPNVEFRDALSKTGAMEALRESDACVVVSGTHPHYDQWLPNKIFDYMASGRPTIALGRGEIAELISRCGNGYVGEPTKGPETVDLFRRIAKAPTDELARRGEAGWMAARTEFSRSDHADRMLEIFSGARTEPGS